MTSTAPGPSPPPAAPPRRAQQLHGTGMLQLLLLVLIAGALPAPAASPPLTPARTAAPAALDALFARWHSLQGPGCAVGIARPGAPRLLREYGSADLEHHVPISADTVFEAGSISKQFTAAAILLLAHQGRLKLTDDVRRYFPELPDYGAPITVQELLNHTSGLRDWGEVEAMAGWPRTSRIYTLSDVLAITARQKSLNYPPGTRFSYTNTGYNLLAILIQRLTGQSLARFSREHLFAPLHMTHTSWRDDFRRIVQGRAIAYAPRPGGGYQQDMPFEDTYGHGGLLTTIGDLLTWNAALARGTLGAFLSAGLQQPGHLIDGAPIGYGRGLFLASWHGYAEIAHPGTTAGYHAWLGRYPQAQLSIALLCNSADVPPRALAHGIADLFLPHPGTGAFSDPLPVIPPQPPAAAPAPRALAPLAGRYFSAEALATWVIAVSGGQLTATALDRPGLTLILKPLGADSFQMREQDFLARLRFNRDRQGRVSGLTMMSPRVYALLFHRIR